MTKFWTTVLVGVVLAAGAVLGYAPSQDGAAGSDGTVQRLRVAIPREPRVASVEELALLEGAAATRRFDVAVLLIRALTFNRNPNEVSETTAADVMLPAIPLLRQFGPEVGPLLFAEALASDADWYQSRIAAAVQVLLPPARVRDLVAAFSLETSRSAAALRFKTLLETRPLRLNYAPATSPEAKDLEEALKRRGLKR